MDEVATSLINMDETIFEKIIRIGLMVGAIFQIACLGACIFLPFSGNASIHCLHDKDRKEKEEGAETISAALNAPKRNHHRNRKQEKKKRR